MRQGMVKVHPSKLPLLIRTVYELSHSDWETQHTLSDDETRELVDMSRPTPVRLDHVKGRACKFSVKKDKNGTLWIDGEFWQEHSDEQLKTLLEVIA